MKSIAFVLMMAFVGMDVSAAGQIVCKLVPLEEVIEQEFEPVTPCFDHTFSMEKYGVISDLLEEGMTEIVICESGEFEIIEWEKEGVKR